ncbi:MAG: T9SS type A sorting domain-containing protein, partial [Bacteroidales bacterium]|nr:T9SS type A sorting domain-containing protein [Bacteroidales bacterium]
EALRYPYTVTTSVSGVGGSISPEGVRPVMDGTTLAVVMTPTSGNAVKEFTVDGSITFKGTGTGAPVGYTFTNIKANHTIDVKFEPVSVDEENMNNISIFPNPNNGKFSVNLGENAQSYVLYDMSGRVVEEKALNGQSVVDFDMNIAAGTYFIKVINNDKVAVEKIVVE